MSVLPKEQLKLIKYCILTDHAISVIQNHLRNQWGDPVFHPDITVNYLNRVVLRNIKRSLQAFQRNPSGRSTYKPLPKGYSPYHNFRATYPSCPHFRELSHEQYESQFTLPDLREEDVDEQENNMGPVQFGHKLPTCNRNQHDMSSQHAQRDTSLLRTSPPHTVTSPPRYASAYPAVPHLPSVGPLPSATRVTIDHQDQNIIKLSGVLSTNKDVNGKVFENHYLCKLDNKGLGHVVFPGGSRWMAASTMPCLFW